MKKIEKTAKTLGEKVEYITVEKVSPHLIDRYDGSTWDDAGLSMPEKIPAARKFRVMSTAGIDLGVAFVSMETLRDPNWKSRLINRKSSLSQSKSITSAA